MNIWTWNINSVRNKIHLVNELLLLYDIDILFLTETKIKPIHEKDIVFDKNYSVIFNSNKTTSLHGVAFVYKSILNIKLLGDYLPKTVTTFTVEKTKNEKVMNRYIDQISNEIDKAHYTEGRILTIKVNDVIIVGTYVPNSGVNRNEPLKRLAYRTLSWDKDLSLYLCQLEEEYKKIIWLGDLNVCIKDNDIHKPSNFAGTTTEERHNINSFIKDYQWIDTWDLNPITDYQLRATYGIGTFCLLRLDYVLCSPALKDSILSSICNQEFKGSDHVPVGTKFEL